ncbi:TrbC/VirB2 family protein [Burkholderia sp. LMG 13014]|uniref:TrbC/VirB2 family protein n=1 Tax=Burkholderia sp. LMG 13014 TaxID=2709306 RepID=UPI001962EAB0|nr:TrbC/VirB2 family protein [Burkholderia sp. LMG 13014]
MNCVAQTGGEVVEPAVDGKVRRGVSLSMLAQLEMVALAVLYVGTASAQSMPWEGGLCTIITSMLGKTSFCLAVGAFFGCGAMLIWGEELTGFTKKLLGVGMGVGVMVGGASLYQLFSKSGITC